MTHDFFSVSPIVFEDFVGKGIDSLTVDLKEFCFGDPNLPLGNTIKKGAQSMRIGYYKIIEEPKQRKYEYNNVTTWACNVLFYKNGYKQPIKYFANIGTLFNFDAKYGENQEGVWEKFVKNGNYSNKEDFFEKGLVGKTLEVLKDEWVYSDKFKMDVKKITWRFN